MKFFTLPALLAAALFSAVVSLPSCLRRVALALYRFEGHVTSSQRGIAQLFYDVGKGNPGRRLRACAGSKAPGPLKPCASICPPAATRACVSIRLIGCRR